MATLKVQCMLGNQRPMVNLLLEGFQTHRRLPILIRSLRFSWILDPWWNKSVQNGNAGPWEPKRGAISGERDDENSWVGLHREQSLGPHISWRDCQTLSVTWPMLFCFRRRVWRNRPQLLILRWLCMIMFTLSEHNKYRLVVVFVCPVFFSKPKIQTMVLTGKLIITWWCHWHRL